jgi:hypothetical protein
VAEARVENLDSLQRLKIAMVKFAEGANVALGDAESEVNRTMIWLQNEQTTYWKSQLRKRSDIVERCREAVRMKKLYKDSTGRQQSAIEEEKALYIALRRKEEAEQKIVNVEKAIKRLEREIPLYKGSVQRFATNVQIDVPSAIAHLENLLLTLEEYVSLRAPVEVGSDAAVTSTPAAGTDQAGAMKREVEEQKEKDKQKEEASAETTTEV